MLATIQTSQSDFSSTPTLRPREPNRYAAITSSLDSQ
jgi:hypothetical protein